MNNAFKLLKPLNIHNDKQVLSKNTAAVPLRIANSVRFHSTSLIDFKMDFNCSVVIITLQATLYLAMHYQLILRLFIVIPITLLMDSYY